MFRFRLQSVLEVRERITRLRQKDYSEVLYRRQGLAEEMRRNDTELARAARNVDLAKQGPLNTFMLQQFGHFRRRVHEDNALLADRLAEEDQELEARRTALVEARRAQRTLEILKEKAQTRFEREERRRERTTMDEVASNYHVYRER